MQIFIELKWQKNDFLDYFATKTLYARATEIAGLEYQSDRLWLEAIGFERAVYIDELCRGVTTANCKRIGVLFDKLLATPTYHAPSHFERYVSYLSTIEPHLLLCDKEYEEIMKLASKQLGKAVRGPIITLVSTAVHKL
uniref:Uncharacterized protein n=1 Tax=Caenorhabditis japonica TaxID=281687 RepID=A0A8R1IKX7_CAEJA